MKKKVSFLQKTNKTFVDAIISLVINTIIEEVIDETNGISEEEISLISEKFDNLEVHFILIFLIAFSEIFSHFTQKFIQKKKMNF